MALKERAGSGYNWGLAPTYHGSGGGRLVDLVLRGLDLGLQVRWRVEVLALVARAAALDVVHADGHCVVIGVDHGAVGWVSEAAVVLTSRAVTSLVLTAHLRRSRGTKGKRQREKVRQSDRKKENERESRIDQRVRACKRKKT